MLPAQRVTIDKQIHHHRTRRQVPVQVSHLLHRYIHVRLLNVSLRHIKVQQQLLIIRHKTISQILHLSSIVQESIILTVSQFSHHAVRHDGVTTRLRHRPIHPVFPQAHTRRHQAHLVVSQTLRAAKRQISQSAHFLARRRGKTISPNHIIRQHHLIHGNLINVTLQRQRRRHLVGVGRTHSQQPVASNASKLLHRERLHNRLVHIDITHIPCTVHRHSEVVPSPIAHAHTRLHHLTSRTEHQLTLFHTYKEVHATVRLVQSHTVRHQRTLFVRCAEPEHQRIVLKVLAVEALRVHLHTLLPIQFQADAIRHHPTRARHHHVVSTHSLVITIPAIPLVQRIVVNQV